MVQEIGIGLVVGLGLAGVGSYLLRACQRRGWINEIWMQITIPALALACFAVAQSLHGSGYIAAFSGGLLFGFITKEATHKLVFAAEGIGDTLAMLTWTIFGAAVISQTLGYFEWEMVLYAVLSLTIIRILPIFLSLGGTGESTSSKMFLGWFGPRGLASIVFAIIVLDANLPNAEFMALVVVCTVFFSLLAHGLSANPLAKWLGNKESGAAD